MGPPRYYTWHFISQTQLNVITLGISCKALSIHKLDLVTRKLDFVVSEQQRGKPACASAQSDQRLIPGRIAQSVTCLATDASLIADPGVASSIPARSHTFVKLIMK